MAKVKLCMPVAEIHGAMSEKDPVYHRVLNGENIMQAKPRRQSEKQRAMRKAFAEKYAGKH